MSRSGPRGALLRWTQQQPLKMATASRIAAPHGLRGLAQVPAVPHSAGPTSSPRTWRQCHRSQPLGKMHAEE
eukprot:205394-Pyramimonas_sp.AAC.1